MLPSVKVLLVIGSLFSRGILTVKANGLKFPPSPPLIASGISINEGLKEPLPC
jgi:hypothetical protein